MRSRFALILTVAAGLAAIASGVSGMVAVDRTLAEAVKPQQIKIQHRPVSDDGGHKCDREKRRESREPIVPEV